MGSPGVGLLSVRTRVRNRKPRMGRKKSMTGPSSGSRFLVTSSGPAGSQLALGTVLCEALPPRHLRSQLLHAPLMRFSDFFES
jgi:hypothetical protein